MLDTLHNVEDKSMHPMELLSAYAGLTPSRKGCLQANYDLRERAQRL